VVALLASSAGAFGGRGANRPASSAAAVPAPPRYYVMPAAPCGGYAPMPPPPMPRPKVMPLANPLPAPASSSNEPPLNPKRAPTISESRSYGGVSQAKADVPASRCRVGFWNITGGDVTLTVDGQTRTLPKDRAVTVNLPRAFVWHISGREAQSETVPEGQNVFEVILRP